MDRVGVLPRSPRRQSDPRARDPDWSLEPAFSRDHAFDHAGATSVRVELARQIPPHARSLHVFLRDRASLDVVRGRLVLRVGRHVARDREAQVHPHRDVDLADPASTRDHIDEGMGAAPRQTVGATASTHLCRGDHRNDSLPVGGEEGHLLPGGLPRDVRASAVVPRYFRAASTTCRTAVTIWRSSGGIVPSSAVMVFVDPPVVTRIEYDIMSAPPGVAP